MAQVPVGASGEEQVLVTSEIAVDFLGMDDARVLGTPFMIGLMEMTSRNVIKQFLDPGFDTVGTHVNVRHLESCDHQSHAGRCEHLALRVADRVRDAHQVPGSVFVEIGPLVDLVDRDHEHGAGGERSNVQERNGSIVTPQEAARDLTGDDAGEDGRHGW